MKFLFELNHPKHYYQFKYVMDRLKRDGHTVWVLARDKDVLLDILKQENVPYEIFGQHRKKMLSKIFGTFPIIYNYTMIVKRIQPDVIVSKASFYGAFVAKIMHKKSVIFPDSEVVTLTNKYVVPLSALVVTPLTFGLDFGKKHVRIKGFFEDCYLSPSVFVPDISVVEKYGLKFPYAIFRFVGWYANHDVKNSGFSLDEKKDLIKEVEPYMQVYISSEKKLPPELEKYRLPIPASLMHHALAFADLYLGDSQTMATEASLLGTPAIRSNSFVGPNDMTNFLVLEKKYGLLKNIACYNEVKRQLKEYAQNSRKQEWLQKKERYFTSVGDTNVEIANLLESI